MALFKRKKKKSEPEAAAEERDLVTPSDLSDDDFRNYINERRNAPADEDEEIDDFTPVPQDETEDVPEDEADAEESAPGEEAEEEPAPPFRSFATEDEYNSVIQKAINEARSKWDLDNQAVKARYERMDRIARAYFPDDDNAFDALGDDLEAQYEERAGRSYDDYLDEEHRNDSASKWDAQEQAKAEAITNREKIINKWVADAGNLKVIEPDFEREGYEAMQAVIRMLSGQPVSPSIRCGFRRLVARNTTFSENPGVNVIDRALEYIEKNATSGITVADVCAHMRISRRLLNLRFREHGATPPGQAIVKRRLEALRKLLSSSSLPISTICKRCGFGSENHPKKLFRQRYGMTMREFRSRHSFPPSSSRGTSGAG